MLAKCASTSFSSKWSDHSKYFQKTSNIMKDLHARTSIHAERCFEKSPHRSQPCGDFYQCSAPIKTPRYFYDSFSLSKKKVVDTHLVLRDDSVSFSVEFKVWLVRPFSAVG